MKKRFLGFLLIAAAMISGCDLSSLDDRLSKVETRLTNLEATCKALDDDVSAMKVAIQALQQNDYITSVTPVKEGEKVTGYVIKFAKAGEIKITNGTDGIDGKTPLFKIEENYWYISYDEGKTWEKAGRATGEDASPILKSVTVGDDEVTFTLQDGTTFSIPRYALDRTSLPNSIILDTRKIENINKGDTVQLDIIVNPSDFAVNKENLSLLPTHHLYTKGENFDKTAHCDLSITEIRRSSDYEGAYTLSIAVGGEGSFFDEISTYVLYGEKNHESKIHSICSNTSAALSVIPAMSEAFSLEIPNQSFYKNRLNNLKVTADTVKTQYMGLWMNSFRDSSGVKKVYDRSIISSVELGGKEISESCRLNSDKFQNTGVLELSIDESASFWAEAIKDYEENGTSFTHYPTGSSIVVSRSGKENAEFTLDEAGLFFKTIHTMEQTIELDSLRKNMVVCFDVSKEMQNSGYNVSFDEQPNNYGCNIGNYTLMSGFTFEYEDCSLNMNFYSLATIRLYGSTSGWYVRDYFYSVIQQPDGDYAEDPDKSGKETCKFLLYMAFNPTATLSE